MSSSCLPLGPICTSTAPRWGTSLHVSSGAACAPQPGVQRALLLLAPRPLAAVTLPSPRSLPALLPPPAPSIPLWWPCRSPRCKNRCWASERGPGSAAGLSRHASSRSVALRSGTRRRSTLRPLRSQALSASLHPAGPAISPCPLPCPHPCQLRSLSSSGALSQCPAGPSWHRYPRGPWGHRTQAGPSPGGNIRKETVMSAARVCGTSRARPEDG